MEIMNVNKALMCWRYLEDRYEWAIVGEPVDDTLRLIQLAMEVDTPDTYQTLVIGIGVLATLGILEWYAETGQYESARKVLTGIEDLNTTLGICLPTSIDSPIAQTLIGVLPGEVLENLKCV